MPTDLTTYLRDALVNHIFRNTSYTRPSNIYLALLTAYAGNPATATEVSTGSYARQAVATGASSGWAAPSSNGATENSAEVAFPVATADWGDIVAAALNDASTSGNWLASGWLSTLRYTFTALNAGDVFTAPGHTLANGDRVVLKGTALPAGPSADTLYYVVGVSGSTFQISTTLGGSAVALTSDGAGEVLKVTVKTIATNDQFKFPAGNFDLVI